MDDRLESIEIKLAFLEQANAELSEVVYRQRQELDALHVRLEGLVTRLEAAGTAPTPYTDEQEKPPHY